MCRKTLMSKIGKTMFINNNIKTSSTYQLKTNNLSVYLVQLVLCNQTQLSRAANSRTLTKKCSSWSYVMAVFFFARGHKSH